MQRAPPWHGPVDEDSALLHFLRHFFCDFILSMKDESVAFRIMYFLYNQTCLGPWYTRRQLRRVATRMPEGHSRIQVFRYGDVSVTAIAFNADNYCYMVVAETTGDCALVDVGDANAALSVLNGSQRSPHAILTTHKHWDHCYGNKFILEKFPSAQIYGGRLDRPHCAKNLVENGEVIEVGELRFTVVLAPGHTRGHVIFRLHVSNSVDCLFTGDFLFLGGIGKMFEGSAAQMLTSLSVLKDLPGTAFVFPGHEYSADNLAFALTLEPDNAALISINEKISELRRHHLPTIPTTLNDEFKYNPFLRTNSDSIWKALYKLGYPVHKVDCIKKKGNTGDPSSAELFELQVEVLRRLRSAKDKFIAQRVKLERVSSC